MTNDERDDLLVRLDERLNLVRETLGRVESQMVTASTCDVTHQRIGEELRAMRAGVDEVSVVTRAPGRPWWERISGPVKALSAVLTLAVTLGAGLWFVVTRLARVEALVEAHRRVDAAPARVVVLPMPVPILPDARRRR